MSFFNRSSNVSPFYGHFQDTIRNGRGLLTINIGRPRPLVSERRVRAAEAKARPAAGC
jgi:hypothetical protein